MGIETALLAASLGTAVAGTAVGVGGAIGQGRSAAASAAYQARVSENQASIAKANAQAAELDVVRADAEVGRIAVAGQRGMEAQGRSARGQIGQLAADQSASGLVGVSQQRARETLRFLAGEDRVNSRAALDSDINAGVQNATDARARVVDFTNQARGAEGDAAAARASGKFARANARSQAFGAALGGVSTILGTATSPMAQNWMAKRGTRTGSAGAP